MSQSATPSEINVYLRPDHQVRVGVYVNDETVIDLNAVVSSVEPPLIHMETFGSSIRQLAQAPTGAKVVILSSETWAFCRGHGILERTLGRDFTIRLEGDLEIQQRREHFRLDVFIPVAWSIPADQQLSSVEGLWKTRRMLGEFNIPPRVMPWKGSYKVLDWNDGPEIEPLRVNLSGGGVRIKLPEELNPGMLVDLDIFLPASPLRVVTVVGSVVRITEIILTADKRPAYVTAMKFVFIAEKDRENIISYIFNEQRNSLRQQGVK